MAKAKVTISGQGNAEFGIVGTYFSLSVAYRYGKNISCKLVQVTKKRVKMGKHFIE